MAPSKPTRRTAGARCDLAGQRTDNGPCPGPASRRRADRQRDEPRTRPGVPVRASAGVRSFDRHAALPDRRAVLSALGFYVGGGGGYSFQNIAVENLTDGALLDENDFSYKVYVGYRFNSLLARELSYANLGRTRVHNTTNDTFRVNENSFRIGSDDDVDITTTSIGLAGLISTPIDGNLVGFAKLGAHIWTTSGSGSGDFTVTDDEEGGSTTNIDIFLGLGAD
ncbi:MAG: outer membrane beta-barrel protein [Rhodospirillaceae bacterium]